ncbi:MAG TPA: hypothetical protein VMW72_25125 [Sedimentisphaerales bacterium]|nr:hypothetical protein [Sedimentisphaerales bacterium]
MAIYKNRKNTEKLGNYTQLYSDKSYRRDMIIVLAVSIIFLMIRFGAIIPDLDKFSIKGFKIISLSKTIAALYLIWLYLYFNFYQKYWSIVKKEIVKSKEKIFKEKIALTILRETHEKHGHDFDSFKIYSIHLDPIMKFFISYSPVSFLEHGEEEVHGRRCWIINLKLKRNRKHILPYLAEFYFRKPIVTAYFIPFLFPVFAWIVCMFGDWPGSLAAIFTGRK